MKTLLISIALLTSLALMTGCEWTTGGNVETWNTSQNPAWANFSGNYVAPDGGILVRTFGGPVGTTNQVTGEQIASGDGSSTAFSGVMAHLPVRGTLTIVVGGYRFVDTGSGTSSVGTVSLSVTPADGTVGTMNFGTRVWSLVFPAPIASGTPMLANYYYSESTSQGNHGKAIYSLVLYQTGNRLQIIDSNSSRYDGTMGSVVGTTNGPVVGQFSAAGSSEGYKVTIVGALQATASGEGILRDRTLNGTYIEEAGAEADIHAVAR